MAKKRTRSAKRFVTQNEAGLIDIGFEHVYVGHSGVPQHAETLQSIRSEFQRGFHLGKNQTDAEWFDREEKALLPLVADYVLQAPDRDDLPGAGFRDFLRLDFGDGPKEYTNPWRDTHPSFRPGESVEIGELVECKVRRTAWNALRCIAQLRDHPTNIAAAVALGGYLERLELEHFRTEVIDGAQLQKARRTGGTNSGRATPDEKKAIAAAVRELASQKEWSVSRAIKDIAAQLRTGRLPGIDRCVDYSDGYIADLVRNA